MRPSFTPLPDALTIGAHSLDDLRAAGITRHEVRGPLWEQWQYGRWVWAREVSSSDATDRIRRAASLIAGRGAIGGWAAAVLHGASDIDGLRLDRDSGELVPEPVMLCLPPEQRSRRTAVHVVHSTLAREDVVHLDGLPVTSVVRTGFDLARWTRQADDALALLDALAKVTGVGAEDLLEYTRHHRRWRGTPQARRVVPMTDPGVRSPQESRMRYLWTVDTELPRPLVNPTLRDPTGHLLGEVDLFDPESGLVGEYDGADHSGAEKRGADSARHERLERAGLQVVRLTAPDLTRHRLRSIYRLRSRYRTGLARDRSQDRWILADGSG